jgi:holo-[acyl-carrier protein] synthase
MYQQIIGHGIDLIEIERIEKAILNHGFKFVKRILHEQEIEVLKTNIPIDLLKSVRAIRYISNRYAAKESIVKAIGTGIGKISFKDIIIEKNSLGAPIVSLSTKIEEYLHTKYEIDCNSVIKCYLTITDQSKYSIASSIIVAN